MDIYLRPFNRKDMNEIIELTLLAFQPVFASFEQILGPRIHRIIYPDWHKLQTEGVEKLNNNEKIRFWVAEVDVKVIGFIAFELYGDKTGEVQLLAVHPDYQNLGSAPI